MGAEDPPGDGAEWRGLDFSKKPGICVRKQMECPLLAIVSTENAWPVQFVQQKGGNIGCRRPKHSIN